MPIILQVPLVVLGCFVAYAVYVFLCGLSLYGKDFLR